MRILRVVIIAGGAYEPCIDIKEDDFVICADHGYDYALKYSIHTDMLIGDFDSVNADISPVKDKISFPSRKDFSDSEIAVKKAIEMKPDEVALLGFTGSRLDHSLANLTMLKQFYERGITAYIADAHNTVYYYKDFFEINGKKGSLVSLVPMTYEISSITTYGLDYPLDNETLYFGQSRGISNVVVSDKAGYKSKSGEGFIIFSKD